MHHKGCERNNCYRCSHFSVDSVCIHERRVSMVKLLDLLVQFRFRWFQGGILWETCLVHMCACVFVLWVNAPIWKFKYGYIIGSGIGGAYWFSANMCTYFSHGRESVPNTTYCITSFTVTTATAVAAPSNGSTPWQIYILAWNHPVFFSSLLSWCSRQTNKLQNKILMFSIHQIGFRVTVNGWSFVLPGHNFCFSAWRRETLDQAFNRMRTSWSNGALVCDQVDAGWCQQMRPFY